MKHSAFLLRQSIIKVFVILALIVLFAWLGYRVGKILGHWEYGLLLFLLFGYLMNLSSHLNEIREKLSGRIV